MSDLPPEVMRKIEEMTERYRAGLIKKARRDRARDLKMAQMAKRLTRIPREEKLDVLLQQFDEKQALRYVIIRITDHYPGITVAEFIAMVRDDPFPLAPGVGTVGTKKVWALVTNEPYPH